MSNFIKREGIFMLPESASALAKKLNSDPEDDWSYKAVKVSPVSKYAVVECYDESGMFVSRLG